MSSNNILTHYYLVSKFDEYVGTYSIIVLEKLSHSLLIESSQVLANLLA